MNLLSAENQGARLKQFFDLKNIPNNQRHLILEYSSVTSYNSVVAGRKGISSKVLKALHFNFKNLNLHWLLTGEGEMMLSKTKKDRIEVSDRLEEPPVKYKKTETTDIEKEVARLKSQVHQLTMNVNMLLAMREKELIEDVVALKA